MRSTRTTGKRLAAAGGLVAGCLGLMWAAPGTVRASVLGVGWDSSNSPVYRLDGEDQGASLIGYSGFRGLNSLAAGPDGALYSVATYPTDSILITIDPETGAGQAVASLSALGIRGLAFDSAGAGYGTLGNGNVIQIDPLTGCTSPVAASSFFQMQGLAFSPEGDLFAWDTDAGLVRIDLQSGTVQDVNPAVGGISTIQSIYFTGPQTLRGARNSVFSINVTTGEATQLYDLGSLDLRGVEVVPEPSAAVLLALAGGALLARRWRRPAISLPAARHYS